MRFATWNCCSGGAAKVRRLEREDVDIAVICEAPLANPRGAATLMEPALAWLSGGDLPSKGIAIAGFTREVTQRSAAFGEGRWALAAEVQGGPSVLGVWSCPSIIRRFRRGMTNPR